MKNGEEGDKSRRYEDEPRLDAALRGGQVLPGPIAVVAVESRGANGYLSLESALRRRHCLL